MDVLCIISAYYAAYKIRYVVLGDISFLHIAWTEEFKLLYLKYVLLFIGFFILTANAQKLYCCLENDFINEISSLLVAIFYTVVALCGVCFVFNYLKGVLISIILGGAVIAFILLGIVRFVFPRLVLSSTDVGKMKSIIICDREAGAKEIKEIISSKKLWLKFEGVIVVNAENGCSEFRGYQCLGNIADLDKIIKEHKIRAVNFIISRLNNNDIDNIAALIEGRVYYLWLYPSMSHITAASATAYVEKERINLEMQHNIMRSYAIIVKRVFDILFSFAALLVFSPLFLIISVMVKLDSPGPVFFKHKRLGKQRKIFGLFKFRTMHEDAEKRLETLLENDSDAQRDWDEKFKLKKDPRITRIGRFLRKTSLDELPQFVNILLGDMSVVGPRPIVQAEVSRYEIWDQMFFRVKPGLTGLWQVSGRNDITYKSRVQLDRFYIRNWSLKLDIYIILKTILNPVWQSEYITVTEANQGLT
jgi:undecaprenyl-phosphate galactose phosphotransferase